jgi:pyruvate kinase
MHKLPKTKIIATIGPSTWDDDTLRSMVNNGMRIARINCSFADTKEIERVVNQIRAISTDVAIILDTMGNKIRVTNIKEATILEDNQKVVLVSEHIEPDLSHATPTTQVIEVKYKTLANDLTRGAKILLDDGNIALTVNEIYEDTLLCTVTQGGVLRPGKTVSIPAIHLSFPTINQKDKQDIQTGIKLGVEYIAISFVRNVNDFKQFKNELKETQIKLIAKIEDQEGYSNFEEILENCDAVMVARGDLGVEIPVEKVPQIQKEFVQKSRSAGKPVIVATQMLESMRENITPTRAEVSDIASAVVEGADAIMLSAETATGKHPVEAVEIMRKVALETEQNLRTEIASGRTDASEVTDIMMQNLVDIADSLNLKGIVVVSKTGKTIASISRHRVTFPIWSISTNPILSKQLALYRGIESLYIQNVHIDRNQMNSQIVSLIYSLGKVSINDRIAIVTSNLYTEKENNPVIEVVKVRDFLSTPKVK